MASQSLMKEPGAKKSARMAIAIGNNADEEVWPNFIGHSKLRALPANNPKSLLEYINSVFNVVFKVVLSPPNQTDFKLGVSISLLILKTPEILYAMEFDRK